MKTKLLTIACTGLVLLWSSPSTLADTDPGPATMVADVVLVRPVCLAATVVGSAFFVLALPLATTSKSVKKTARGWVSKPAKATFSRPLGDMDVLIEDND